MKCARPAVDTNFLFQISSVAGSPLEKTFALIISNQFCAYSARRAASASARAFWLTRGCFEGEILALDGVDSEDNSLAPRLALEALGGTFGESLTSLSKVLSRIGFFALLGSSLLY